MRPIVLAMIAVTIGGTSVSAAADKPPLTLIRRISLPGVEGRIDHMAVDRMGQRLFVAALGNNTLEVLDLKQGKRLHAIAGLREPQGVAYLPLAQQIVVANGDDGACRFFDGQSYQPIAQVDCQADADNVRYDPRANRLFVGCGQGSLVEIGLAPLQRVGDIRLSAHPESFQLVTDSDRIFVNVPRARQVVVLDRQRRTVIAQWPMGEFQGNYPLALDEKHHRLLVGCRKPATLVVLDADTGRTIATLPCAGDTDDVFYEAATGRIYVSGGEGAVSVIEQVDADHYRPLTTVPTAAGARTSLLVAAMNRLYVAVPHRGSQAAEILEFATLTSD